MKTGLASSKSRPRLRLWQVFALGLAIVAGVAACQTGDAGKMQDQSSQTSQDASTQASGSQESTKSAPTVTQSAEVVQALWEESPHADTYVLSDAGENSTCARCHAPVQWIPSMEDMPESCSSCKFEVDPPPPVIPESEWTHVECKVCHKSKKGKIDPQVAWLEIAPSEEYAEVESTTALCDKCHLAGDIPGHASVVVGGDHAGFSCTDCHDAHAAKANCGADGCHADVLPPVPGIAGHDEIHASVSCSACHDAAGLEIAYIEETGRWETVLERGNGSDAGIIPFTSHTLVREAPCERCHYESNPWGLQEAIEGEASP